MSSAPIAIIPARGGSKRIPGKNIKFFFGKPIIAYSIIAAKETGLFDRIIVSTDANEIGRVAKKFGAEVPFIRPAEISNDTADTEDVLIHALQWLSGIGQKPGYFCCIYATAPFIQPADLQRGYDLLCSQRAATAFAVTTYPYTIFRSLRMNAKGRIEMFWPENLNKRSQELPQAYHDAGQFYWADTQKFLESPKLFSEDSLPVVIPRYLVQDIDTAEDWEVAERIMMAAQMGAD